MTIKAEAHPVIHWQVADTQERLGLSSLGYPGKSGGNEDPLPVKLNLHRGPSLDGQAPRESATRANVTNSAGLGHPGRHQITWIVGGAGDRSRL